MKNTWPLLKQLMERARRCLCAFLSKLTLRRGVTFVVALSLWMGCGGICGARRLSQVPRAPAPSFGEIHWYMPPDEKAPLPTAEVLFHAPMEISE